MTCLSTPACPHRASACLNNLTVFLRTVTHEELHLVTLKPHPILLDLTPIQPRCHHHQMAPHLLRANQDNKASQAHAFQDVANVPWGSLYIRMPLAILAIFKRRADGKLTLQQFQQLTRTMKLTLVHTLLDMRKNHPYVETQITAFGGLPFASDSSMGKGVDFYETLVTTSRYWRDLCNWKTKKQHHQAQMCFPSGCCAIPN